MALIFTLIFIYLGHAQRQRVIDWGVGEAVRMATVDKYTSPHRMMARLRVKRKEAEEFLDEASHRGLLHPAANGRYYVDPQPVGIAPRPHSWLYNFREDIDY